MKNLLKIVSIIGLTVITQIAYSAPNDVTATFTTGDTLTAEKLNNIKDVVNDNYNRITNIELTSGPVTYALGDTGPAGGFVFYVTDDGLHGLEAAPEDIGGNASATLVAWGCDSTELSGMNETGIGSGAHNTSQRDLCSDASTAAKAAAAYKFSGYTDWFLPSRDELGSMWTNLADPLGNGRAVGSDTDSVGGFASYGYWSSSQSSRYYAWYQHFKNGSQNDYYTKNTTFRVRAVRAF
jgi:hypothetical protein